MLQLPQCLGFDLADALPVTENCRPIWSSMWSVFMPMPNR